MSTSRRETQSGHAASSWAGVLVASSEGRLGRSSWRIGPASAYGMRSVAPVPGSRIAGPVRAQSAAVAVLTATARRTYLVTRAILLVRSGDGRIRRTDGIVVAPRPAGRLVMLVQREVLGHARREVRSAGSACDSHRIALPPDSLVVPARFGHLHRHGFAQIGIRWFPGDQILCESEGLAAVTDAIIGGRGSQTHQPMSEGGPTGIDLHVLDQPIASFLIAIETGERHGVPQWRLGDARIEPGDSLVLSQ